MSSRLKRISTAERPKMHAKALLSGPSGAGKTWSALSIATVLADGGDILVVDTEKESALTYADRFRFEHLPWDPPFDPTELAETLIELNDSFAVVIVDSLTHFWRGTGGTLDIADGKFTGWKGARPVQNRLIDIMVGVPAHAIYCVRSKMEYLAAPNGRGGYDVEKLGLAPVQDDSLIYEMNVGLDISLDHVITVSKSRSPALPVGRMYPASHEVKAASDYAEWLAGGVPPASAADVILIRSAFDAVVDKDVANELKRRFKAEIGVPDSLTENQVHAAKAWIAENVVTQSQEQEPEPTGDVEETSPAPPADKVSNGVGSSPDNPPTGDDPTDRLPDPTGKSTAPQIQAWASSHDIALPVAAGWKKTDWINWASEKIAERDQTTAEAAAS